MSRCYTVRAERSGAWWALTVDGVPFAHSQARSFGEVGTVAADLLADMFDADPGDFRIAVVRETGHRPHRVRSART